MLWPIRKMDDNARASKAITEKTPEGITMLEKFKKCFGYVGEAERKKALLQVESFHYSSFASDQLRRALIVKDLNEKKEV